MSAVSGVCSVTMSLLLQQLVEGTCSASVLRTAVVGQHPAAETPQPVQTAAPMRPVPTTPTVRSRSSLPRTSCSR